MGPVLEPIMLPPAFAKVRVFHWKLVPVVELSTRLNSVQMKIGLGLRVAAP